MASLTKQLADRRRRRKVARWLARADAPAAADTLQGIQGCAADETSEQKLSRLARWSVSGRREEAVIELHDWRRSDACPNDAIALLAGLLIQMNQKQEAALLLASSSNLQRNSDPVLLCLNIAMEVAGQRRGKSRLIEQLYREHGHDPAVMRWLTTIMGSTTKALPTVSEATINQLAGELLEQIDAIPSLIAAQRLAPDAQTISMLRGAMHQVLRDVEDQRSTLILCQAMADLAMLASDPDDARRWAHRGLRIDPYAAPLAIILSRMQDDPALGPPASSVLKGAVNAHPKYPDLRAALIRREASEGRIEVAKRRLHQWLQREPNQAMALRLQHELAA